MRGWKKFIDSYKNLFYTYSIAPIELSLEDFKWLKKECVKAKKQGSKANKTLIGHLKEEYHIQNITDSFNIFLNQKCVAHENLKEYVNKLNILSEPRTTYLDSFWVNYMKKHEFNPPHDHQGLFSFVIFVKIPYDLKKEENYFSEITVKKSLAAESQTSKLNFLNTNPDGKVVSTIIPVDKSFEGKMFMFPSTQLHLVHPFYTSNDYRITVSGNLRIKV